MFFKLFVLSVVYMLQIYHGCAQIFMCVCYVLFHIYISRKMEFYMLQVYHCLCIEIYVYLLCLASCLYIKKNGFLYVAGFLFLAHREHITLRANKYGNDCEEDAADMFSGHDFSHRR